MIINLKKYYSSELKIIIDPSEEDILYDFFDTEKKYNAKLPQQFYKGKRFVIRYGCLSCKKENKITFLLHKYKWEDTDIDAYEYSYSYIDVGRMSTLYHSRSFIDLVSSVFGTLTLEDCGHFFGYSLLRGGGSKVFYQKCPHCNAQYLATYKDIQGQPSERTDPATPYEFYIEEMAWVEFDEEEFFREMQEH